MEKKSEIVRVNELCRMLSISIPTLYRWHSIGEVPIRKVRLGPGTVGYRRSEVEKWMNGELEKSGTEK